jgi:membrane associated rhomboid family serine protease
MDGPGTAVRVTPSRRRADEWAVVLAAADIPHWLRQRLDGWALLVPPDDAATALATLAAYDQENSAEGVGGGDEVVPSRPLTIAGAVVALLLIGFFATTGPRVGRSAWFEHGSADATRMMAGEWWRAITALTLHADAPHLLGNAVAIAGLMTAVCWYLGPGVGLWLLLLAGAGGNALTAAAHGSGHVSVGASTAVFGAIGVLAALRIVTPRRVGSRARKWWVVIAASLALLALLGTGPHADVLAHLFGFLVGGGLGLIAALTIRWPLPAWVQWLLVTAAGAAVSGAWRLAF